MTIRPTERTPIERGEALAADIVEKARKALRAPGIADPTVTDEAIALRWFGDRKKNRSYVGRLFDAGSGANISYGRVLALPETLARAILVRGLASLDAGAGPTTRDTLDRIGVELGHALADYLADLRDGREDRDDVHEANLTRLAAIVLRGIAGIQKRRAAREATT